MKTVSIIFLAVSAACVAVFFLSPFRRYRAESFKPRTLSQLYRDIFKDVPRALNRRTAGFYGLGLAGIVAAFYPAAVIVLLWSAPRSAGGSLLLIGGFIALLGAAANFAGILLSQMHFGFGGGPHPPDNHWGTWAIPLSQALAALASIAMGLWPGLADVARMHLSD